MTKEERMRYLRQSDLIDVDKLSKSSISIIGAGSVGSFTALTLGKMGVGYIEQFDEDGVTPSNLSGQFFKNQNLGEFKVDSLGKILTEFTETSYKGVNKFYTNQPLNETVILATDSMSSRKLVWEQFLKQKKCKYFIDSRMGAELAKIYTIRDKSKESIELYEETLHGDDQSSKLPCTARTIIYNVLLISSLIGRSYKAIIQKEKDYPREIIMSITKLADYSLMLRE